MTNPHIELVEKWLDNPESVSAEELKENASAAFDATAASAAAEAFFAAVAAAAAADGAVAAAKYWVKRDKELEEMK